MQSRKIHESEHQESQDGISRAEITISSSKHEELMSGALGGVVHRDTRGRKDSPW